MFTFVPEQRVAYWNIAPTGFRMRCSARPVQMRWKCGREAQELLRLPLGHDM